MYQLALMIFVGLFLIAIIFRNRLLDYAYDPYVHLTVLSIFSVFFAVPYLMLSGASRYQVSAYSTDAQLKYLLFVSIFSFVSFVLMIVAAKARLLMTRSDVALIVMRLQVVSRSSHWLVLFVLAIPILYSIYQIGSTILSMGFGIYLANRIIVASGSGYLFVSLIFPVFAALILSTNYILRNGLSIPRLLHCMVGLLFASLPLLLSGSRSSLVVGLLIFAFIVFILSSIRGLGYLKKMLFVMGGGVVVLIVVLTMLGVVRQSIMGASDFAVASFESEDNSSSSFEIFGSNENLLWFFDNSDRITYQLGATYAAVLVGPYPRSFWPGKPTGAGPVLKNWIAPGSYDLGAGENISSYTTGFMSEAFMNFGWFGALVGPLVLALMCIILSRMIRYVRTEIGIVCWAVVALRFMGFINAEFYGVCIHIFVAVAFFGIYKALYNALGARRTS